MKDENKRKKVRKEAEKKENAETSQVLYEQEGGACAFARIWPLWTGDEFSRGYIADANSPSSLQRKNRIKVMSE